MAKKAESAAPARAPASRAAAKAVRMTVAEHGARSRDPAVHAGVAAHRGWRDDQVIAESTYAAATAAWLGASIDGGGDGAA